MNQKLNKIYFHAFFIWLLFAVITVFFGAFREIVFIPLTGLNGNLARALLLPLAFFYIFGITYLFLKKTKAAYNSIDSIKIGILWLVLTILFEFSFGGLVMGHSLDKLLADYNLLEGKTWGLFLICILIAPYLVNKYMIKKK
ncbi:MAG: hypothetical protein H6613_08085 [Ignavibacteriales bacterium]|nr:hypothetical protein [Ignavibacteriales bacterium]